jgi:hypothetical protein
MSLIIKTNNNMKKVMPKKTIVEKATGEKYPSKKAMMKHEKSEGKKVQSKEQAAFLKMIAAKSKKK